MRRLLAMVIQPPSRGMGDQLGVSAMAVERAGPIFSVPGVRFGVATGDVPAALGAMADDIQWTEADGFPLAGTYVGPQAVLEGVFMRLGEIGDDFAVVPEQFVADGETVVALGSYRWKHKSSGEPAVVKMAHVWTMNGGKAVALQQHVDILKVRELS
jgi:uncharacterized protein